MTEHDDVSRTTAEQVADELRDAFQSLASVSVPAEERAAFQRRLLAITTTAKRDVGRAKEQLERLRRDVHIANTTTDSSLIE